MKTFNEFTTGKAEQAKAGFPTFTQVKESNEGKCMSEGLMAKCNEMYEAMCEEMKACHEDETEMTAETYTKECSEMMKEMMEGLTKACESCMA
jgi:hypothetical protein